MGCAPRQEVRSLMVFLKRGSLRDLVSMHTTTTSGRLQLTSPTRWATLQARQIGTLTSSSRQ